MRKRRRLTLDEARAVADLDPADVENIAHGIWHLTGQVHERRDEIARASNMIRATLDGTPLSIQYAAVLELAAYAIEQMRQNPHGCPED
jgi:hypothetical protein